MKTTTAAILILAILIGGAAFAAQKLEAAPAPLLPLSMTQVTPAINGETMSLDVGQRFLLNLGAGYTWSVLVGNSGVLNRVPTVLNIAGTQGLFEAARPGTTLLTATGVPLCPGAQQSCNRPSASFEIQIVVQ